MSGLLVRFVCHQGRDCSDLLALPYRFGSGVTDRLQGSGGTEPAQPG